MEFDRGYIPICQQSTTLEAEFGGDDDEDFCYVLVNEKKLSSAEDLLPVIELVNEKKKGLLIIAEDIDGDARQFLVLNCMQGGLKVCAIKAPGFGDRRKAMLEDIAVATGATAIMEGSGTTWIAQDPESQQGCCQQRQREIIGAVLDETCLSAFVPSIDKLKPQSLTRTRKNSVKEPQSSAVVLRSFALEPQPRSNLKRRKQYLKTHSLQLKPLLKKVYCPVVVLH